MLKRKSLGTQRAGRTGTKGGGAREGSRSAAENPDLVQTDGKAAGKERKHIFRKQRKMEVLPELWRKDGFGGIENDKRGYDSCYER